MLQHPAGLVPPSPCHQDGSHAQDYHPPAAKQAPAASPTTRAVRKLSPKKRAELIRSYDEHKADLAPRRGCGGEWIERDRVKDFEM
jgi:hypothetical protein